MSTLRMSMTPGGPRASRVVRFTAGTSSFPSRPRRHRSCPGGRGGGWEYKSYRRWGLGGRGGRVKALNLLEGGGGGPTPINRPPPPHPHTHTHTHAPVRIARWPLPRAPTRRAPAGRPRPECHCPQVRGTPRQLHLATLKRHKASLPGGAVAAAQRHQRRHGPVAVARAHLHHQVRPAGRVGHHRGQHRDVLPVLLPHEGRSTPPLPAGGRPGPTRPARTPGTAARGPPFGGTFRRGRSRWPPGGGWRAKPEEGVRGHRGQGGGRGEGGEGEGTLGRARGQGARARVCVCVCVCGGGGRGGRDPKPHTTPHAQEVGHVALLGRRGVGRELKEHGVVLPAAARAPAG
jgi:hypothetical protein